MCDEIPYHEWTQCEVHGHEYHTGNRPNLLVCKHCGEEYEDEDGYAYYLAKEQGSDDI